MHIEIAIKVLGVLLMMFSATMLPPVAVSLLYADNMQHIFLSAFAITFAVGFVLWLIFFRRKADMRIKDGFLITVFFYLALGVFGALPFLDERGLAMSIPDALFESFSGLTTTGATVIVGLDHLPESLLYYRQQLQWLGGMGIIVLAVAILPMLGIGGMQLYRAETPGPVKDSKLTPRIKETALALWSIYLGLTVVCAFAYWTAGMSGFDAICHSFSTIAIGGFSTHDASIGYFDSPAIESIAIVFMIIAGINFGLHFFALKEKSVIHYLRDDEVRFYLSILLVSSCVVTAVLYAESVYGGGTSLRMAVFSVVSIFTTTGFATADFAEWPNMLPYLIFFGAFTGACAGSTGGGMKVIRVMLICKQGLREVHRLIHPNAIFPVKVNHRQMSDQVMEAVWGFFSVYVIVFLFMQLALIMTGLDFVTAFSAVGATLNNLGPGLGTVALNYSSISDVAKLLLCFTMALGRLEIFTLLVLFSPMFWRK
ncbi:MAG: potassium transporter [Pseudomonadales bacterium]|nr:potassium transporter [Pseudomonadales bacterium]MBO6564180.1 potassium transporter [Pseudomonadales bacterium]MBO6596596.1 potassium transporter [Pseudomonadales bacterium]MBO6656486.1 potassium transporter [Pseudomonadales bacterium]MBO6703291.1 potassium transporter [Pseudomonadales bacterium]